jgi:phosphopantothenoylcysteine decarboxylase/phosphopantothenate--cysteine ligase
VILLSVGAAPGALDAPAVARELAEYGRAVEVVLEPRARHFVGPAAFAPHARVVEQTTERPEALVFSPATSGTLARLARGLEAGAAGRLYGEGVRPAVVVPDLDDATRDHPAVQTNLGLLRSDGCRLVTGERSPVGVASVALNALGGPLSGVRVLVTAGGTQEPIDRVRIVGNRSSGKMGRAVAREALRRGAEVTVVAANVEGAEPGVSWVPVEDYRGLREATLRLAGENDVLVMAAAVSDFTPVEVHEGKIRRGGREELELRLAATGDVLAEVRERNGDLLVVGFAATFGDPEADAREKLASKGADLVVGNDISLPGAGFGAEENEAYIAGAAGGGRYVARSSKTEVARVILDEVRVKMEEKMQEEKGLVWRGQRWPGR